MQDVQEMFSDVWQETSRVPWAKHLGRNNKIESETHFFFSGWEGFVCLGYPKMDGENNGKPLFKWMLMENPYEQIDDLGGKIPLFLVQQPIFL